MLIMTITVKQLFDLPPRKILGVAGLGEVGSADPGDREVMAGGKRSHLGENHNHGHEQDQDLDHDKLHVHDHNPVHGPTSPPESMSRFNQTDIVYTKSALKPETHLTKDVYKDLFNRVIAIDGKSAIFCIDDIDFIPTV